jgi:DNA-binding XRE family transcriptional regulator
MNVEEMSSVDEVNSLQRHLPLFRACAGWTAKDLADQLEVSRQSISAWENYNGSDKKGVKLSKGYYLAIRHLLETAVAVDVSDETELKKKHILGTMLEVLVDHPEKYTSEDVDAILKEAQLMAPSIMKQPEQRKSVSKVWPTLLAGCGIVLSAALIAILGHDKD